MFRSQKQVRNVLSACVLLVSILFCNVGWAQTEETYKFDVPTIDKIIVDAEVCIANDKNLSKCEALVKSAQDQLDAQKSNLDLCEQTLGKKDQLYGDLLKVKDTQLKMCEDTSIRKDKIITDQRVTIDNVDKLVEAEKTKNTLKDLWLRIEWATIGAVVGTILGFALL